MRMSIFLFKLFFFENFNHHKECSKMDFPLYFQKVIWVGGTDFVTTIFSEKAKHTGICPSFGGTCSKHMSFAALLSPP